MEKRELLTPAYTVLLLGRDLRTVELGPKKSPHPPIAIWNQPLLQRSLSQEASGKPRLSRALATGTGEGGIDEKRGLVSREMRSWGFLTLLKEKNKLCKFLGPGPWPPPSAPLLGPSLDFWEG